MARSALGGGHTSCRYPFTTRLSPFYRLLAARLSSACDPFTTLFTPSN